MRFERVLKRRHAVALAFGAMIGWSWVLLSGIWIERAGAVGVVIAFLATGVAMILIALTYAELASAMPRVGGEHVYAERAFGRAISFICSWGILLGYVSVIAFEVVAFPYALSYLFPIINQGHLWQVAGWDIYLGQVAIGIGGMVAITSLNVRGLATAARVQALVTAVIILAGVALLVGAGRSGVVEHFAPAFNGGLAGIMGVVVMLPLMFLGFDIIPQAAEEIDLEPRKIGMMIVVSIAIGVLFYTAVVVAVAFVLDGDARAAAELPTAHAAAVAFDSPEAGTLLVCAGLAGIVTSWNGFLVGASRLSYALTAAGLLPRWLIASDRDETAPRRILWTLCLLCCFAPWFGRPILVWLVDAGSVGVIVGYAIVALSFLVLRQREPAMPRPYRVPWGPFVGTSAFILPLAIGSLYLPWSPSALVWPQEWLICAVWALAGFALYNNATSSRTASEP
ncbi:MAG: APC family permease [Gammaproteobacteria bacterium]